MPVPNPEAQPLLLATDDDVAAAAPPPSSAPAPGAVGYGSTITTAHPPPVRITTSRLRIASMCCPREAGLVEELLGPLEGVVDVKVNVVGRVAVVRHRPPATTAALLRALNAAHLGASVQDVMEEAAAATEAAPGAAAGAVAGNGGGAAACIHGLRAHAPLLAAAVGLALSAVAIHRRLPRRLQWAFALPCALVAALPMGPGLHRAARLRRLDMTVLMAAAATGALLLGDLPEALAVLLVVQLADGARQAADARVARSLDAAGAGLAPPMARVLDPGQDDFPREVPSDAVRVGEVVLVRAGEQAPVDGRVVRGEALMDEATLTGECMPVPKQFGATVYGGSLCQAGAVRVECSAPAAASGAQAVRALVQDVAATTPPTQELLDWVAGWYTAGILALAAASALAPLVVWVLGRAAASAQPFPDAAAWRAAVYRGLELLVLACPCALAVASPLPFLTALAASTQGGGGVLFRSAAAMEALGRVGVVALDKTGTLTEGRFRVSARRRLASAARLEEGLVRRLAASLEALVAHRLSAAVVADALGCVTEAYYENGNGNGNGGKSTLAEVTGLTSLEGVGVEGECVFPWDKAGRAYRVAVGNEALLQGEAPAVKEEAGAFMAAHPGQVHLFVVVDGVPELALALADSPRPEARGMLAALKGMGVSAAMLTGDSPEVAAAVEGRLRGEGNGGERLLGEVVARMKPADKLRWVRARQGHEPEEEAEQQLEQPPRGGCCSGCGGGGGKGDGQAKLAAAMEAGARAGGVVVVARAGKAAGRQQQEGALVAMVGDGVNDGPALAAADAGVAMGEHGTALAVQYAGVVLLGDDLRRLPQAVRMARAVRRVMIQNVALAVAPKLAFLALLAAGRGRLWMAVATDAVALAAVLANGLRPLWLARAIYGA